MTELQIGLIALGAAAVAGVIGYNKWQENRHRKLAEAVLQPAHDDVLLGEAPRFAPDPTPRQMADSPQETPPVPAERVEPVIDIDLRDGPDWPAEKTEPVIRADVADDVPTLAPTEPFIPAMPPASGPKQALAPLEPAIAEELPEHVEVLDVPHELLDPRTEFIVAMELVEPVVASQILNSQRDVLQQVSKPIHWIGYNEKTREWERLTPESELPLRRLRVGLQLVNRLGPVTDAELAVFSGVMQVLADELMAVALMNSTGVRDLAKELDTFCASVDLEIGVNLISKASAFSGTKIRALAEAAGMVLGVDGLFTRYDDAGHPLFRLQNFETAQFSADTIRTMATHGLTFLLDVPRVDHGERVFVQMTELAKRFAETLQGALVDDNRAPLGEPQLDHIRREFVGKPQAAMVAYGLPAGSPQALRLFS